jgi:hypothetical protein
MRIDYITKNEIKEMAFGLSSVGAMNLFLIFLVPAEEIPKISNMKKRS